MGAPTTASDHVRQRLRASVYDVRAGDEAADERPRAPDYVNVNDGTRQL